MIDLSIVIVNWNTVELLRQCLRSLPGDDVCPQSQVWVVDNASSDGSPAAVRSEFPQVHLIENSQNVGFAKANNQGIRASSGRYILLLNSDTIVMPETLPCLVEFLDAHPEAGVVGADLINQDGTPQLYLERLPSLASEFVFAWGLDSIPLFRRWLYPPRSVGAEYRSADCVLGAALMVRREVLNQVGLLDEKFFMYSEEIDLAYRVKKAGWQVHILNGARIVHLGGQSTRQMPAAMKAALFRSKIRYFSKHKGSVAARLVSLIFATSILAKCLAYRLSGRMALAALWSETWQHYAGHAQLSRAIASVQV